MSAYPAQFTTLELWFIEQALPPRVFEGVPDELNDLANQVGDGLAFCYDNHEEEVTVLLTEESCRLIQALINVRMYAADETPVGKNILLKSFRASRAIRNGEFPLASSDGLLDLTKEQTMRLLAFQGVPEDGESTSSD